MTPRDPYAPDCAIKDCTRVAQRSGLCRKHHELVPFSMVAEGMSEVMRVSHRIGQKHRARQVAYVRRLLRESGGDPQGARRSA